MNKRRKHFLVSSVPFFFFILLISQPVFAAGSGGFENASLDAKALGRSNAFVARADNPSAISYNSAGMSQLPGLQVSGGFTGLNLMTDFDAAPGGVDAESAKKLLFVPNLYSTIKVPRLPVNFGFGINAPFGLATQYSSTSPFRYVGFKNRLEVVAYTMSGSIQVLPQLSVGAGATYYDAKLKQQAKINSNLVTQSVIPGFPDVQDAPLRLDADGNGWGWNLGALWKPHPKHSIGFNYRSMARLAFKGHLNVEDISGPVMLAIFGKDTFETAVNTDIVLPPQVTVGYAYKIKPNWDLEADLGVTGWSVFGKQEFALGTSNPVLAGMTPILHGYHDVISVHVGSDWDINRFFTIRGGYFFYQTPARGGHLGPVIPDSNRNGISTGLSLNYKSITVDLAYIAEFFVGHKADGTDVGINSGVVADGTYSSFLNLFSFNVTYRFGWGEESGSRKSLLT